MKRIILIGSLLFTSLANATGIPVVDVTSVAQMIASANQRAIQWGKEASQWAKENNFDIDKIKALKDQHDHYRKMVEGHFSFEDLLNDPNFDMSGWREIYGMTEDISELREQYGLKTDDNRYDDALMKLRLVEKYYERTQQRTARLQGLLTEFEKADTPSKKADLANAISLEQTKIGTEQEMLASIEKIQKEEADLRHRAESRRKIGVLFGKGLPRPKT